MLSEIEPPPAQIQAVGAGAGSNPTRNHRVGGSHPRLDKRGVAWKDPFDLRVATPTASGYQRRWCSPGCCSPWGALGDRFGRSWPSTPACWSSPRPRQRRPLPAPPRSYSPPGGHGHRRGSDHALHPVDHHQHLPAHRAGPGDRYLGRDGGAGRGPGARGRGLAAGGLLVGATDSDRRPSRRTASARTTSATVGAPTGSAPTTSARPTAGRCRSRHTRRELATPGPRRPGARQRPRGSLTFGAPPRGKPGTGPGLGVAHPA